MLSAIYFTHLFSIVGTPDVNVLLSFKAVKQDIAETSIKVDFDSRDYFLKYIGLC